VCLLPGGGNGGEKIGVASATKIAVHLKSRRRLFASLYSEAESIFLSLHQAADRIAFKFKVTALKNLDDFRVIGYPRLFNDQGHCLIERQGLAILAVGSHGIQAVHSGQDTCADGNLFSLESIWIAFTVPLLMMRAHDGSHGIGKSHAFEDICADSRVNLHLLEFFRSETPRFVDDVIGNRQFADVVQQRRGPNSIHVLLAEREFLSDLDGIGSHAMQMLVRGVILGVNCQRKALDGAQMEGAHLFHMASLSLHLLLFNLKALLLILQPAQVKAIRPVDDIHDRHDKKGILPTDIPVAEVNDADQGSPGQVIRQSPEISLLPDLAHRAVSA
jgi:hypothetical protein